MPDDTRPDETATQTHRGRCLCGAVRFAVAGPLRAPDACHCSQCRRQSGHYWASTNVAKDSLTLEGAEALAWYRSSETVRRGFCSVCGSVLFWEPDDHPAWTAVAMGAFDAPTGTRLEKHIHVADKGDYYDLADGVPQEAGP
ncbi:MAG TPA: GFA family protein [Allosphingosinicella sp.]|jgi:hypothetical protein